MSKCDYFKIQISNNSAVVIKNILYIFGRVKKAGFVLRFWVDPDLFERNTKHGRYRDNSCKLNSVRVLMCICGWPNSFSCV